MKTIPLVGSTVAVDCQYITKSSTFTGVVVKPHRGLSADEFCLQTGNPDFPISVINLTNVVRLEILKGSTTNIRKFKVSGSKGEYLVTLSNDNYSCSCIGFKYHHKCKHITKVKEKITS